VRIERDELVVAERVAQWISEQGFGTSSAGCSWSGGEG
jgi:hypothetical protein